MTIDEYLNQLYKLKKAEDRTYQKLVKKFDRATSTHNSAFDGMPHTKSNENIHETRLIEYADTKKEWNDINRKFFEVKEQIEEAVDYLLYWEGRLIYQLYVYNVFLSGDDPMDGAAEILHTKSRQVINNKLAEAKAHMRQLLIDRGIELE